MRIMSLVCSVRWWPRRGDSGPPSSPSTPLPTASAQPCPDTQVVFARGKGEDPGVGPTGQAFVDALRGALGGKSLDVYPVNYPPAISGRQAWTASGMPTPTSSTRPPHVPTPKWCSAVTRRARPSQASLTSSTVPDSVPKDVDPATIPKPLDPGSPTMSRAVVLFGHLMCGR